MEKDLHKKIIPPGEANLTAAPTADAPTIRIIVCGKRKSGKSCLIRSYLKSNFSNTKQDTGINIYCKKIIVEGEYDDIIPAEGVDEYFNQRTQTSHKVVHPEVNVVIVEFGQQHLTLDNALFKEIGIHKADAIIYCFDIEEMRKTNFEFSKDEAFLSFNQLYSQEKIPMYFSFCKLDTIDPNNLESIKIHNNDVLTQR